MRTLIIGFLSLALPLVSFAGPRYGGGQHSSSHGGRYAGGHGKSHKAGTYRNAKTGNQYGTHK